MPVPIFEGRRIIPCIICKKNIEFETMTTNHPEAPEMVRPAHLLYAGTFWVGIQFGEDGAPPTMLVTCGTVCTGKLLSE